MITEVYVTTVVLLVVAILIAYLAWNFKSNNKGQESILKKNSNTEEKCAIDTSIKVLNFVEFAFKFEQSSKSQK